MVKKLFGMICLLLTLVVPSYAQTAIDIQPAPTTIEQVGALADPGIHNIDNAHVYGWTGTAWSPSDAAGIHPIINAHLYTWNGSTWNPASTSSVTISNVGSSSNTQVLYNASGSVSGTQNAAYDSSTNVSTWWSTTDAPLDLINLPTATLAGVGAGNLSNGVYQYCWTSVTPSGETPCGTQRPTVTITDHTANGQVSLQTPGAALDEDNAIIFPTGINTYRTAAGGAIFKLVTNCSPLSVNEDSCTDNTADADLGVTAPTTNTTRDAAWAISRSGWITPAFSTTNWNAYWTTIPPNASGSGLNWIINGQSGATTGGAIGFTGGTAVDGNAGHVFLTGGESHTTGTTNDGGSVWIFGGNAYNSSHQGGQTAHYGELLLRTKSVLGCNTGQNGLVWIEGDNSVNYTSTLKQGTCAPDGMFALPNAGAITGDTTAGHTYTLSGYDTDTGPAYVTFVTVTNGTAPSFVLTPPAGGSTVEITANDFTMTGTTQVFSGSEVTAPSAPAAEGFKLFAQDNGSDKTQLCARFNSGAVQCFATEP